MRVVHITMLMIWLCRGFWGSVLIEKMLDSSWFRKPHSLFRITNISCRVKFKNPSGSSPEIDVTNCLPIGFGDTMAWTRISCLIYNWKYPSGGRGVPERHLQPPQLGSYFRIITWLFLQRYWPNMYSFGTTFRRVPKWIIQWLLHLCLLDFVLRLGVLCWALKGCG